MKNDTVCKEKASNVFLKEREQYFEIQDLKAQLQDKDISISELKKLIEKNKGNGVDTNFEKQSILGKPPSQPIKNRLVIRQPTAYNLNDPNCQDIGLPPKKSPKHVSFQSRRESVGSNDMVHNYYLEEPKKKAQLQNDKTLNTKPSVQQSARLPNTANGTDKAKIARKRSKPDKHGHGNGRARKEPGECYQKWFYPKLKSRGKVKLTAWMGNSRDKDGTFTLEVHSEEAQHVTITDCHAGNPCELRYDLTAKINLPMIERMNGSD
ncbi:hypothetical protein Tco_0796485 [Tanacetum coccineum]